jgi:hypothetical protein
MTDIEYLRQAMHAETTDLPMRMPVDRIHRRARGLLAVRIAAVGAAFALVVSAAAVPAFALFDRAGSTGGGQVGGGQVGGPLPASSSACDPALGSEGTWGLLGPPVDTGSSIEGPDQQRYDVVIALTGERDDPWFTVAFRNQRTGHTRAWDMIEVPRGSRGDFAGKGRTWYFQSSQLPLSGGRVLDAGIYSRAAHRITVASEGRVSEARISHNAATGLTFFWVERTTRPLPADANVGPQEYEGPERLTITAYDAAGQPQHTVTGGFNTGNHTQNPRDNSPDPHATPTPGVPCS